MKSAIIRIKGGAGSGNFGHGGRPGKVGGSSAATNIGIMGRYKVEHSSMKLPFGRGKESTIYTRDLPNGFVQVYTVTKYGDGDLYEVETNRWAQLNHKDDRSVYIGGTSMKYTHENDHMVHATSVDDAMKKAAKWEDSNEAKIDARYEKKFPSMGGYQPLTQLAWKYRDHATKWDVFKMMKMIRNNPLAHKMAQETLDKLPWDENGEVTLYRGGSPEGFSWSLNKLAAETFATYSGLGSVPSAASMAYGFSLMARGQTNQNVTIHERKFKRSDMIMYMAPVVGDNYEQEVLINPRTFHQRRKEYTALIYFKGGRGSGNFGHSGRQGKVGGSAPGKGGYGPNLKLYNSLQEVIDTRKGYTSGGIQAFITLDGKALTFEDSDYMPEWGQGHEGIALEAMKHNPEFRKAIKPFVNASYTNFEQAAIKSQQLIRVAYGKARSGPGNLYIEAFNFDTAKLHACQQALLGLKGIEDVTIEKWGTGDSYVSGTSVTYQEFMTANRAFVHASGIVRIKQSGAYIRFKGGPGSGNFGHAGRPGKVGGSSTVGGTNLPKEVLERIPEADRERLEKLNYSEYSSWKDDPTKTDSFMMLPDGSIARGGRVYDNDPTQEVFAVRHTKSAAGYMLAHQDQFTPEELDKARYILDNNIHENDELQQIMMEKSDAMTIYHSEEEEDTWVLYTKTAEAYIPREQLKASDVMRSFNKVKKLYHRGKLPEPLWVWGMTFPKALGTIEIERIDEVKSVEVFERNRMEYIWKEEKQRIIIRLKGGSGSGNFNHAGRPGKVGGSAPESEALSASNAKVGAKVIYTAKSGNISYGEILSVNGDSVKVGWYKYGKMGELGSRVSTDTIGASWTTTRVLVESSEIKPTPQVSAEPLKEERQSLDEIPFKILGAAKSQMRGYFISGDDRLIDITDEFGGGSNDHPGAFLAMEKPEIFGMSKAMAKKFAKAYEDAEASEDMTKGWDAIFNSGAIRVRQFGDTVYVESRHVDRGTLRRLQKMHDINKFNVPSKMVWSSSSWDGPTIEATAAEFLSAKYVTGDTLKESNMIIRFKGGPGSGNFNHAGRPGKIGGSYAADKGGAGYGSVSSKPLWAGSEEVTEEGFTVRNGRFAAANKWSVDEEGNQGPLADSPAEAVKAFMKLQGESSHNQRVQESWNKAIESIKKGSYSKEDFDALTGHKPNIVKTRALSIARAYGMRATDAERFVNIVKRKHSEGFTASGYELINAKGFLAELMKK